LRAVGMSAMERALRGYGPRVESDNPEGTWRIALGG